MGEATGFLKWGRQTPTRRPVPVRLRDWKEVYEPFDRSVLVQQAGRCMDCGIPFCNHGCPLGNLIPDWNDLVYRDHWRDAIERLHATNNFPEFTGRLCPAPCEGACVLGISDDPVTIKQVEVEIIDRAWAEGWVTPQPPIGAHPQAGRRHRLRAGRPGRRPAADARRPRRGGAGALRPDRRAPALRHPRVQDGEAPPRPPPGPDAGRGHRVPHRRRGRPHHRHRRAARHPRRHRAGVRGHAVARPAGAGPGAARHPPGHGVPADGQPVHEHRRRTGHHRRGQARRDHRRRRHRCRLPRHRRTARARPASTSSRSWPARPTCGPPATRGPRGRSSCARRRPTRRAASGCSPSTPSASSTTAHGNVRAPAGPRGRDDRGPLRAGRGHRLRPAVRSRAAGHGLHRARAGRAGSSGSACRSTPGATSCATPRS